MTGALPLVALPFPVLRWVLGQEHSGPEGQVELELAMPAHVQVIFKDIWIGKMSGCGKFFI